MPLLHPRGVYSRGFVPVRSCTQWLTLWVHPSSWCIPTLLLWYVQPWFWLQLPSHPPTLSMVSWPTRSIILTYLHCPLSFNSGFKFLNLLLFLPRANCFHFVPLLEVSASFLVVSLPHAILSEMPLQGFQDSHLCYRTLDCLLKILIQHSLI